MLYIWALRRRASLGRVINPSLSLCNRFDNRRNRISHVGDEVAYSCHFNNEMSFRFCSFAAFAVCSS